MTSIARLFRKLEPALGVAFLGFALWIIHHELEAHTWAEIQSDLLLVPRGAVAAALLFTALNYVVISAYDALGVRYAGVSLSYPQIALTSSLGTAMSQGLGFPLLTGTPVRLRLYGRFGLPGQAVAKVVWFVILTAWVGLFAVAGSLLAFTPPSGSAVPPPLLRAVGGVLLIGFVAYVVWVCRRAPSLQVGAIEVPPPTPLLGLAQVIVSASDWLVSALVLYVLLPDAHPVGFLTFAAVFVSGQALGVISHVPGGLGVFEATLVTLMPGTMPNSTLFASLVVYRVLYYIVPLLVAGVVLVFLEVRERIRKVDPVFSAVASTVPTVLAAVALILGAVLLFVGAVPVPRGRLGWLETWLDPLAVNISHFLASVVGATLLIVARGLQRRLSGAYHVALIALLMLAGLAVTAFASPALSAICAAAALALWLSRDRFYRRSSLLEQAFTGRWLAAIALVVVASAWLGFFAFRDESYNGSLWWRFTMDAGAPRFLRGTVGVASVLLIASLARLLRPAPHQAEVASPDVLDRVAPVVEASPRASAHLAFLGDKSILMSESSRSFVMYGVRGSSWISMGDPVGDESEFAPLLWDLRERADRAGDVPIFYQVTPTHLHLYVDMGMALFKVGEEGRVPLGEHTLEGKTWADLRQALRKLPKAGAEFSVVPAESVGTVLEDLRAVSDDWLDAKNTQEKGFSLGAFSDDYLTRDSVAVVTVESRIVAFASLWTGTSMDEFSGDLMRYATHAPKGVMDFLFASLLLWGRDQGYSHFNLGMSPLAGLADHRLAPVWHRLGDALYDHGERFYNFQGLRQYKEKFDPQWESRYLAVPSLRHLPAALADVATLIAGGYRGIIKR